MDPETGHGNFKTKFSVLKGKGRVGFDLSVWDVLGIVGRLWLLVMLEGLWVACSLNCDQIADPTV